MNTGNIDTEEVKKFSDLADGWWQSDGPFRTLHDINPVRTAYIEKFIPITNLKILDIGCGGGLLCETLARLGAMVTGIDASGESIETARTHAESENLHIEYKTCTVENFISQTKEKFDVITCMELLEHVPHPESLITSCEKLLKPGGDAFFSTINRNWKAYLLGIVAAERILHILPANTHDYSGFIRPSELVKVCRNSGFDIDDVSGIYYNPFNHKAWLTSSPDINYLVHARKRKTD